MKLTYLAVGLLLACSLGTGAQAANYPAKPIHIVIPWPAGGLVDILGRAVAEKMHTTLAQPIIVENKPGAGGIIGTGDVAHSAADGYTILLTTSAMNMSAAIHSKLPFDVEKSFEPVAVAAYTSLILVASPTKGPKSVQDLIALAKNKPGALTYASAGMGTPGHFAGEMLKSMEGLDIVHVPYKGGPPAMVDQIAGRVDFHFANAVVAMPQIRSGKIKALAVASPKRLALLPDVPTMIEQGISNFNMDQWLGYLVPAGTPSDIVNRLNQAINAAIEDKAFQASMEHHGMTVATPGSAESFKAYLKQDHAKWAKVANSAHIKLD